MPLVAEDFAAMMGGYTASILVVLSLFLAGAASECLSDARFKSEHRLTKLETAIEDLKAENLKIKAENLNVKAELAATRNVFRECIANAKKSWALKRVDYPFPSLAKVQLHHQTVTYNEKIPTSLLPKNTKAVIISILCHFWNPVTGGSDANMFLAVYQKGNEDSGIVNVPNKHYGVYGNWFYKEVMIPWNGDLSSEAVFKLTQTYNPKKQLNWYEVKMVGVITE